MFYPFSGVVSLGSSNAGQASNLRARLINPDGTNNGPEYSGLFVDLGDGIYQVTFASMDDSFYGSMKIYLNGASTALGALAVYPYPNNVANAFDALASWALLQNKFNTLFSYLIYNGTNFTRLDMDASSIVLQASSSSLQDVTGMLAVVDFGTPNQQVRAITGCSYDDDNNRLTLTVDPTWTPTGSSNPVYLISPVCMNLAGGVNGDVAGKVLGGGSSGFVGDGVQVGLTAEAVRAEIDANSAKLDVSVSSRLAAGDFVAPNNASIAAIKAKTDLLPGQPAAVGSPMTVSDKTGFKLASDGLDAITTSPTTGPATNLAQMIVQLWRRFFKQAVKDAGALRTFADDGTTVLTTQSVADDGVTQTQGPAT
jgi:hypothetical protein